MADGYCMIFVEDNQTIHSFTVAKPAIILFRKMTFHQTQRWLACLMWMVVLASLVWMEGTAVSCPYL